MKRVVIIGGGFAGATAAKRLGKSFDVTLIDSKEYFEFTPGILRGIAEPGHVTKLHVPHVEYLKHATIVVGDVTKIDETSVFVGKKALLYDYLIVSAGSSYSLPIKEPKVAMVDRGKHMLEAHIRVSRANNILIVGGGLVGVELAAEIATTFPDKRLTLVHAGQELMERNAPRARKYALNFLEKHGVAVRLGKMMDTHGSTFLIDEKPLPVDVAFYCTGIAPNTSIVPFPKNEKGYVIVNEHMQVNPRVYAPGDLNTLAMEKTGQNAQRQAIIAAENIMRTEKGKPLISYVMKKTPMCISLGRRDGILELNGLVLTGFFPGWLKCTIEWWELFKLRYF